MLYSLIGKLTVKKPNFLVLETAGLGFKILISSRTSRNLPKVGGKVKLFCATSLTREDIELYGFLSEKELEIFEMLNTINGIGPKAALKILQEMRPDSLLAAISHGRAELLTKAAGVGKKKAARIILELADKIKKQKIQADKASMEENADLEEILKTLGYKKSEIREAVEKIPLKKKTIQEKIKIALKLLSPK